MEETPKKRIGRPPKPAAERKERNFTFRTRPELRAQLTEAAAKSGRSISEEIEYRLDRTFMTDELSDGLERLVHIAGEMANVNVGLNNSIKDMLQSTHMLMAENSIFREWIEQRDQQQRKELLEFLRMIRTLIVEAGGDK
jgi:hypothetical protein